MKTITTLVLTALLLLPLACGQNLAVPTTSSGTPVTVIATATYSPTPFPNAGTQWFSTTSAAAFGDRSGQEAVTFNNKMWVIGGFRLSTASPSNDVWSSTDGATWTQVLADNVSPGTNQFPQRYFHQVLAYDNQLWVIGGLSPGANYYNDVWSSPDGVTWTERSANSASPGTAQFSQRANFAALTYGNLMWVIGGQITGGLDLNDVWSSPDGISWTNVLADTTSPGAAQFGERGGFTAVTYKNLMWVIGGVDDSPSVNYSDVWNSSNGSTWTSATLAASFGTRVNHSSVVYDNLLWVIGGATAGVINNDVWSSPDGAAWTQVLADHSVPGAFQFSERSNANALAYNNLIWIIAGNMGPSSFLADVWYTP